MSLEFSQQSQRRGRIRDLRTLPEVAAAFRAGRIGTWHVTALADAAPRIDDFPRCEAAMVQIALIARDRGCIRCGKPPRYTEAHHIIHWRNGGLTEISNLCLLYSRCHHDLHMGHFDIEMGADGIPIITTGRGPPSRRTG